MAGKPLDNEKRTPVKLTINPALRGQIDALLKKRGQSLSQLVHNLLVKELVTSVGGTLSRRLEAGEEIGWIDFLAEQAERETQEQRAKIKDQQPKPPKRPGKAKGD